MTFKDIVGKKILYTKNMGDEYYWSYKHIIEVDENTVTLVNEDGSFSGWSPYFIESIDKEFLESFISYGSFYEEWEKSENTFEVYEEEFLNSNITLFDKKEVLKILETYNNVK
jgi:hypothetical protein